MVSNQIAQYSLQLSWLLGAPCETVTVKEILVSQDDEP